MGGKTVRITTQGYIIIILFVKTLQSESWSEQLYTAKAKFQVTTLTGLDELAYRVNQIIHFNP